MNFVEEAEGGGELKLTHCPTKRNPRTALPARARVSHSPLAYFFFLAGALRAGAAAQGVDFKPSIFAFSASIVSMNGSFVKALGTPLN